ncbi:hypothetical protein VTN02DRAFT_277 [Thermoascus thermophilus]
MADDSVPEGFVKNLELPERTVSTICDLRSEIPESERVQSHMLLWRIPVDNLHEFQNHQGVLCGLLAARSMAQERGRNGQVARLPRVIRKTPVPASLFTEVLRPAGIGSRRVVMAVKGEKKKKTQQGRRGVYLWLVTDVSAQDLGLTVIFSSPQ